MTLTQALDYVRRRHNAVSSTYWSDEEVYALISARANIIASHIGVMDETDSSTATVSGTQNYAVPSDCIQMVKITWNGYPLQEITFREAEEEKLSGSFSSGDPEKYYIWEGYVYLVPIPDSAQTLKYYYKKSQAFCDDATDTLNLPAPLHYAVLDGVLGDMYAKTQNVTMATFYENKFNAHLITTIPKYLIQAKQGGRAKIVIDSDTAVGGGHGIY